MSGDRQSLAGDIRAESFFRVICDARGAARFEHVFGCDAFGTAGLFLAPTLRHDVLAVVQRLWRDSFVLCGLSYQFRVSESSLRRQVGSVEVCLVVAVLGRVMLHVYRITQKKRSNGIRHWKQRSLSESLHKVVLSHLM